MILHRDDPASSFSSISEYGVFVKWFNREWIYDSDVDAVDSQLICRSHCFDERYAATNHSYTVLVTFLDNLLRE